MPAIILDHETGTSYDQASTRLKNLHAHYYLPEGLHFLADGVRNMELSQVGSENGAKIAFVLNPDGANSSILTNSAHWFANTLTNYLRFVALIQLANDNDWTIQDVHKNRKRVKKHCTEYVKGIVPDIHRWRNKISAHFAITDPRPDDTTTLLTYSAMYKVTFQNPYYLVSGINWGSGGVSTDFKAWSLSKTFDELAPRFWPDKKIQPLPEVL
jgi:hypothetical protein